MFTITNKTQLGTAYVLLRYYQKAMPRMGRDDLCAEHIKEMKRAIRKYNHRPADPSRIVRDNGIDGYVVLLPLPESLETMEDAKEYFEDQEVLTCRPSMYDCTGQAFTSWYKIFQRHGRFWAYHSVCFDV